MMDCRALLFFLFAVTIASVECNVEGDILNAWKVQLTDPNNILLRWTPSFINPCTWFYITCNSDNSVVKVDLHGANLSGILIPELGFLTNLEYLYVGGNNISASIPEEIGNLRNLKRLDLYQNQLTGTILDSLGNLHSLKFLRLFSNNLTGPIPHTLGKLTSLEILDLNSNKLTGTVPEEVMALVRSVKLYNFNVSDNLLLETVSPPPTQQDAGLYSPTELVLVLSNKTRYVQSAVDD